MRNPDENPKVIEAVNKYLSVRGLSLPANATFGYIIDGVHVYIDEHPILMIGLPPVSDYPVYETKYTDKYLRPETRAAI